MVKRMAVVVLLLSLVACGDSGPAGGAGSADAAGEGSAFCEKGARIGDTSVLSDVDSSSPETFEETYTDTLETLEELVDVSPAIREACA